MYWETASVTRTTFGLFKVNQRQGTLGPFIQWICWHGNIEVLDVCSYLSLCSLKHLADCSIN